MDNLDKKILTLLSGNARMTVKDISEKVNLTSPAVSERIRRLEKSGIIEGYTVRFNPQAQEDKVRALVSMSVAPERREEFSAFMEREPEITQCFKVTGAHSHMVKVSCRDIPALEALISKMQKFGATNTQIILSEMEKSSFTFQ